jgi:transcription-repair coupling factor (superfamily II helicase)
VRLGLYRRIAELRRLDEIEALVAEFTDRFGTPPEMVHNLLYQLKIKLLAEQAGLASVTAESGQIVLRYSSGSLPENLPDLGDSVRVGKVALWMPYTHHSDWPEWLVEALEKLASSQAQPAVEAE